MSAAILEDRVRPALQAVVNDIVFDLETSDESTIVQHLKEKIASTWNYAPESVKLISHGRLVQTNESLLSAVRNGQHLRALGSSTAALESIRRGKADPLVRPPSFDTPGTRPSRPFDAVPLPRRSNRAKHPYGFDHVRVLETFPDAAQARALLERLIADPGVEYVMQRWRWRVDVLQEMAPDGRVGIDPVCILGLNQNRGSAILLRLRTDDLAGFRRYDAIREVLAHELAHNEYGDHNDRFYQFMREILTEMNRHDWRRQRGYRLGSLNERVP
jgi:hypothetical protein